MVEGTSREHFLARLGPATSPAAEDLSVDHELLRLVGPEEDLLARFMQEAAGLGMQPRLVQAESLELEMSRLLSELAPVSACLSLADGQLRSLVLRAMHSAGCEARDTTMSRGIAAQYDVDIGITDVCHGVAETGSLILNSAAGRSRGAHLVPPIHLAILYREQILPDLVDFFTAPGESELATAQVFVTGPSKTADIEGVLVTGVHGPRAVHILVVDN